MAERFIVCLDNRRWALRLVWRMIISLSEEDVLRILNLECKFIYNYY